MRRTVCGSAQKISGRTTVECRRDGERAKKPCLLDPAASSPENQINNYYRQHKAQTAAAVIANARSHVVSSATGEDKQNDENDYQRHGYDCTMRLTIESCYCLNLNVVLD
jgi:hypothetical protein